MTTYSLADVTSRLQAIVNAKGADYVYQQRSTDTGDKGCVYAYDGQPDCIVGHLLVELGVPVEDLDYLNPDHDYIAEGTISSAEYRLEGKYGISFSPRASDLLSDVQCRQDDGVAWGEALAHATADGQDGVRNYQF